MKNVTMKVVNGKLVIECDLSKDFGKSKSGKSIVIASTGGNVNTPDGSAKIGLNVYKDAE